MMTRWMALAVALCAAPALAAQTEVRPGILPQVPSNAEQWFGYSHAPALWGIDDPDYLRAFLATVDKPLADVSLLDPALTEDHYERSEDYLDPTGVQRRRRVYVLRVSSPRVCSTHTCPWVVAQSDGRTMEPVENAAYVLKRIDTVRSLELAGRHDDAARAFASSETWLLTGDSSDRTNWTQITRLRACDDEEPHGGFRFTPTTVWPGKLVRISAGLQDVSICGTPHQLSWPKR